MWISYLAWFLDIFTCGQEDGQDIVSSEASEVKTSFLAGISLSLQYDVAIQYAWMQLDISVSGNSFKGLPLHNFDSNE